MILHNLTKTCDACPAQWEATNEEGQRVYIRYRFDNLTVHCPFDPEAGYEAFEAAKMFEHNNVSGNEMRGVMDEDEMLRLTGYTLAEGEHWQ